MHCGNFGQSSRHLVVKKNQVSQNGVSCSQVLLGKVVQMYRNLPMIEYYMYIERRPSWKGISTMIHNNVKKKNTENVLNARNRANHNHGPRRRRNHLLPSLLQLVPCLQGVRWLVWLCDTKHIFVSIWLGVNSFIHSYCNGIALSVSE